MTPKPNEKPLQSWKEIAAFLDRDVRTAHRWEKSAGLPVRRYTEGRRSAVYAYPSEIEAWRVSRPVQAEAGETKSTSAWARRSTWIAVGGLAAALVAAVYGPSLNPDAPVAEAAEDSMRTEAVWTDVAADTSTRLSPDGKFVTYADWSTGELWLRDVATGASRVLTNDGDWDVSGSYVEQAMVSPDGKRIATAWMNHDPGIYELRVGPLPAAGETDNGTAVYQPPANAPSYVDVRGWLGNEKVLFGYVSGLGEDSKLAVADLETKQTKDLRSIFFSDVSIPSPDGRWIAFGHSSDPHAPQDIWLLSSDGATERLAIGHPADDTPVAWTPDGSHLLFRSSRTTGKSLWALPVRDGEASGPPRLVANDFAPGRTVGMSPSGELYYLKQNGAREILEARLDFATGRLLQPLTPVAVTDVGDSRHPAYSPDGKSLAYFCQSTRTCDPIVVRDLATGSERGFATPGLDYAIDLDWSGDSASLLFKARNAAGDSGAYRLSLADGKVELLFTAQGNGRNFGWMRGDRAVHYRDTWNTRGAHRIHDLETGEEREFLPAGSRAGVSLSPDGSQFAVMQDDRRDEGIVTLSLLDVASGRMRKLGEFDRNGQLTNPSSVTTAWTPDGKTVLFWASPAGENAVSGRLDLWSISVDGGEPRKTELSVDDIVRPSNRISVHPDGERIAVSAGNVKYEVWKLSNFLDRIRASD